MTDENSNNEQNAGGQMPSAHHVAFDAHYKIDGLLKLLIKKGLVTENEYENSMKELIEELQKAHANNEQQKDNLKE